MPEILSSSHFSKEVQENLKPEMSSTEIAALLKEDVNLIGEGGRTIVAAIEGDDSKLIAVSRKEMKPEEAKRIYYNHKILNTLFPDHFAKIHAAAGKTEETKSSVSYTIRERIFGDHPEGKDIGDFNEVISAMREIGVPIHFDTTRRNFVIGIDGHTIYVDTINFSGWQPEHEKAILDWMEKKKMTEGEKELVKQVFDRIFELAEENKSQ